MYSEDARLASFGAHWPIKGKAKCIPKKVGRNWLDNGCGIASNNKPSLLQLAEAGFYYTGTQDSPDAVRCFLCLKDLDGWERNDDPM